MANISVDMISRKENSCVMNVWFWNFWKKTVQVVSAMESHLVWLKGQLIIVN